MYLRKLDLSGRVAAVTGAGRNIGYACADALSEAGAHLVLTDLDEELGQSAVSKLAAMGRKAEFVRLDVTDSGETDRVAAAIATKLGRVDILVANAGIASHSPAEEIRCGLADRQHRRCGCRIHLMVKLPEHTSRMIGGHAATTD
ncbi:NAD(P)-dependent dehydrogenase (short-subunit alcohol dehydrogenase family) [Sinorhizobium kostiense]|uniref:NAD(P)-dependent dehydrogenase (Short-subunit alcohol dehydrogenase family) n=1 Tax=Sinorhizobium kostiense TaxID=76747 RepID=A0ABS4QUK9_9HYPH|nr:SDR family NAD(P)-dependent oxidoreductase [Sinorhizobium kostiense]MBP2234336.1 NAD(P)-dependent dehydrogenase (short-subunit alcohol dehydrogenase family) [Sinorhizobium kostiense]